MPDENILVEQAYEKAKGNYPAILGEKRPSKRKQIAYYQDDTKRVKTEINGMAYHKPIEQEVQINPLSQCEQGIENIRKIIEKEESSYTRQDQKGKII